MKRCPMCSAFASNDATTCFECLYSFEHMTSLEANHSAPPRKQDAQDGRTKIPVPVTGCDFDSIAEPESKPALMSPCKSTQKSTVITIRIDSPDAEVVVEHEPPQ